MKTGTLVHGVASSEHLDSSGERIIIAGMDISSLERGEGTLTWEHKGDNPAQVVGKILKAKKIFSEEDCQNPQELYFWQKCQVPFVYIVGELFDGVGHNQAQEIASMIKYDSIKRSDGTAKKNVINFSVEGAKVEKQGMEITKSIARKVTLTVTPCNKAAIAEELTAPEAKKSEDASKKNPLDGMFKTENPEEVLILEKSELPDGWLKKTFPGNLTGIPALTREHMIKNKKKEIEEAFKNWPKADQLIKFFQHKNPALSKTEAVALAKMAAWKATKKAEEKLGGLDKTWTPGVKTLQSGQKIVAFEHPQHGTVTVQRERGGKYANMHTVQHNGAIAGLKGVKGVFHSAAEALKHAKGYTEALSRGTVAPAKASLGYPTTAAPVRTKKALTASEDEKAQCPPVSEGSEIEPLKKPPLGSAGILKNKSETPLMKPYRSEAQRRWAHTEAGTKALGGKKAVKEWDTASRGKDLPEKVEKRCWEGYEPVPGKKPYSKGSCKPVAKADDMEKKDKPFHGYNPKKHSKEGGLSDSYRKKYNREHGSKLKRPVTGKVKPGSEAAKRRKSFCARMSGVSGPTSKEGKLTPKGAALKRWKCR